MIRLTDIGCVCTDSQAYFTVDNYDGLVKNTEEDDIRFEFKTSKSKGLIMYAGGTKDSIEVAYKEGNVFMYNIDLYGGKTNNKNNYSYIHMIYNNTTYHSVEEKETPKLRNFTEILNFTKFELNKSNFAEN